MKHWLFTFFSFVQNLRTMPARLGAEKYVRTQASTCIASNQQSFFDFMYNILWPLLINLKTVSIITIHNQSKRQLTTKKEGLYSPISLRTNEIESS